MFYEKYKAPVHLNIITQHSNLILYTSELFAPNHFICLVQKTWWFTYNTILAKDCLNANLMLVETSAVDSLNYFFWNKLFTLKNSTRTVLYFNQYFSYQSKLRLTCICIQSIESKKLIFSAETFFKNANWLEREASEMFNINFLKKKDTRPLLLDYSKSENVLLKNFPCEGVNELYYNFLDHQLQFTKSDHVEL